MTARRRTAPIAGLFASAVLLSVLSVLLTATEAGAQLIRAPYATAFANVAPGASRSATLPVHLPVTATVTSATLTPSGRSAAFLWSAQLCDASGECIPVRDTVGRTFEAGTYHLTLTVVAASQVQHTEQGSVSGRIVLVGQEQGLAVTGASPAALVALAAGCATVGLAMLMTDRRRRRLP